jgi:hypothetical protein
MNDWENWVLACRCVLARFQLSDLISPSEPIKRFFTGDRVDFELQSKPTFVLIEIEAIAISMMWCGES